VHDIVIIEPTPTVEHPYDDLSYVQFSVGFSTDKLGASAVINLALTPDGSWKIWTMSSAIETLLGFPEQPERDGHMTGAHSWSAQRAIDTEMKDEQPEVLIIGGGQK
jgi:hypothetical protein